MLLTLPLLRSLDLKHNVYFVYKVLILLFFLLTGVDLSPSAWLVRGCGDLLVHGKPWTSMVVHPCLVPYGTFVGWSSWPATLVVLVQKG